MRRGQLLERKPAHARRIADPGLRDFHDRLGDGLRRRLGPFGAQRAQRILVRRHDAVDVLGPERTCCNKL